MANLPAYSRCRRGSSNWEITTDGASIVARNRVSGETFSGTRAAFYALIALPDGDTGNMTSGGSGVIGLTGRVTDCNRHLIFATHASAAISTIDVCIDYVADTWITGVFTQPMKAATPNTWVNTLTFGTHGLLIGQYDVVRINGSASSAGRVISYWEG